MVSPSPSSMMRSNSAIDAAAAQRAKVRAQYAALSRQKVGSGTSLRKFTEFLIFFCEF